MNPPVSGIPVKLSMNSAKMPATRGALRARPDQLAIAFASPEEFRTRVITANAPTLANPYTTR